MIDNLFAALHHGALRVLLGFAILSTLHTARAATIINDGALTVINGVSDDIEVRDSAAPLPTTVEINTGAVVGGPPESTAGVSVGVFDNSTVNLLGGELLGSFVADGNSVSTISGGVVGNDLVANGSSTVTINAPVQFETDPETMEMSPISTADDLSINDAATINFSAGYVDTVSATGGTFNFSGGRVDDIDEAGGTSRFNISGDALVDDDAFFVGNAVVEVSGGRFDDEFQLYDNTAAFFSGGEIGDDLVVADNAFASIASLTVGDTIEAEGSSLTAIGGGTFGAVEAAEGARVFLFGGTVEEGVTSVLGGTINISGATLLAVEDGPEVTASLTGTVNLTGTTLEELGISAGSSGRVVATGVTAGAVEIESIGSKVFLDEGSADSIDVSAELESLVVIDGTDAGTLSVLADTETKVEIRGGLFGAGDLESRDGSTIKIFGSGFTSLGLPLGAGPIPFVAGDIKGFLADGSPFDFTFRRDFAAGVAAQIVLVPEPTALALLALMAAASAATHRSNQA